MRQLELAAKATATLAGRVATLETADTSAAAVTGRVTSDSLGLVAGSASAAQGNWSKIQAALDAMAASGGELLFGRGLFNVDVEANGPLLYPQNVSIRGVNRIASRVIGNGTTGVAVFAPARGTANDFTLAGRTLNVLFENLGVWNGGNTAGNVCIDARQVSNSDFRFLDLRNSELGLHVGNVAYANDFASIQCSGVGRGFLGSNGCNENDFTNCRVSGCTDGFVFEDGSDSAINAITVTRCTVESFSGDAIRVDHSGTASNDFQTLRFHDCRFTSGTYGFHFIEQSTGEIVDVLISGTHNDGVTNIVEFEIGGATFTGGSSTVQTAMRAGSARRFLMIHGGKIWPVRFGFGADVESASALVAYTGNSNQVNVRANTDTVNADLAANDITVLSNGTNTERVNTPRLYGTGADLVAGDFLLSAGWGASAAVVVASGSSDLKGRIQITASGAGIAANPTVTLTFTDGAWPRAPVVVSARADSNATAGEFRRTSTSATATTWTFVGAPVSAEQYILEYHTIG